MSENNVILSVNDLTVSYGAVIAFSDVSFDVNAGEFISVIGPNGAGKSTLLKAIVGILFESGGKIEKGTISYKGNVINGQKPYELIKVGISLVPEGRRVFADMSVEENLEMGGFTLTGSEMKTRMEEVFKDFPILRNRRKQRAGTLSGGEQQMLALGRSMMLSPDLLFLDEPSIGLSPNYVSMIFDKLIEIKGRGTTVFLVEQNARMALVHSDRSIVFKVGSLAFMGKSQDLMNDDRVRKAFLGG